MALILKACVAQECDGLSFSDTTRDYDPTTRPGGYGSQNGVTGPSDFDTYTLTWWDASLDPSTDPPSAVIDLLQNVPTQSADQDYDWPEFSFEELGVTSISDGVAYFEVVGVKDGDEYRNDFAAIFTKGLYDALKPKMALWKPGGCKKEGCIPVIDLWDALMIVRCGGTCNNDDASVIIDWIRANMNSTCC